MPIIRVQVNIKQQHIHFKTCNFCYTPKGMLGAVCGHYLFLWKLFIVVCKIQQAAVCQLSVTLLL